MNCKKTERRNMKLKYVDYKDRKRLTLEEKEAVDHYKDINTLSYKWDYKKQHPEEKPDNTTWDCYMINGRLRRKLRYKLTTDDEILVDTTIKRIRSAISKSTLRSQKLIYRGINPNRIRGALEKLAINKHAIITEDAFGSYTELFENAESYAIKKNKEEPSILSLQLNAGNSALWIDSEESERLLPPKMTFVIKSKEPHIFRCKQDNKVVKVLGYIYHISELK